jgi:Fe-S-cluster containining protein
MIISKNTPKEIILKLGESCEDCSSTHHCCRHDAGFLAEDDLKKIAGFLKLPEKELKDRFLQEKILFNRPALKPKTLKANKPYGPCVFLDDKKGCKIHPVKPLQCRLYTCKGYGFDIIQWFYLNYMVDPLDPQSLREYSDFIRFNEPIPGGRLEELVPDKEKLSRILSYELFKEEKQ